MLKEAIEKIVMLGAPTIVTIDGQEFVDRTLTTPPEPMCEVLRLSTLGSLVEYVAANRDELDLTKHLIHVTAPIEVALVGPIAGRNRERETVAVARASPPALSLESYLEREVFQIQLAASFADGGDKDDLLRVVGNMQAGEMRTVTDDGISQEVVTQKTAASKEREIAKRVVTLRPFRTFPEVEQPEVPFVFRIRSDGERIACALFEADGGAWRLEAMERVATWIKEDGGISADPPVIW